MTDQYAIWGIFKAGAVLPRCEQPHAGWNRRSRILDFGPWCEIEQIRRCDRELTAPEGPFPLPSFQRRPEPGQERGRGAGRGSDWTPGPAHCPRTPAFEELRTVAPGPSCSVLRMPHATSGQGSGGEGSAPGEDWADPFPRAPLGRRRGGKF